MFFGLCFILTFCSTFSEISSDAHDKLEGELTALSESTGCEVSFLKMKLFEPERAVMSD